MSCRWAGRPPAALGCSSPPAGPGCWPPSASGRDDGGFADRHRRSRSLRRRSASAMTDRLERLTNLVATLLDTRRPLTLEEIVELVPGYPDDKLSYRRQFERDKDTLRGIGIPVRLESVDGLGPGQGDRVPPDEYYLPPLDLTADEQAALHVAVTAVRLEGGPAPTEALWKLGGREGEPAHALAPLPTGPAFPAPFDAYRSRSTATFTHRGPGRHVDPWGHLFRPAHCD